MAALHNAGFEIAIETNGTRTAPPGIDWVCVSPKAGEELKLRSGDELKLVFPQVGAEPERYADLAVGFLYLQPMDGPEASRNTRLTVEYCLSHPQWRVSLQRTNYSESREDVDRWSHFAVRLPTLPAIGMDSRVLNRRHDHTIHFDSIVNDVF